MRNPFDIFSPNSPLFREETEGEEKKKNAPVTSGQSPFDIFSPSSPLWQGEGVRPKPGYGNLPPEADKFMADPTGIPAKAEQMSFLEKALTILDPLMLPGDVVKAFTYGALIGGAKEGLRLAREQLSRWETYLPGGKPADPVVRGDELARLLDPNYDDRSAAGKLGLAVLMDVMVDPLAVFGIAKAGLSLAASGARAAGAARTAEVISKGAELAGKTDVFFQQWFNPYGLAVRATKGIGGSVIDAIADRVEPILQTKLFERTVYGPQGEKIRIPVYIKDLIFPGFSPGERNELLAKIPSYLGGPETGPGIVRKIIAEAQENIQASVARISVLENILAENLGEKVLPVSARKVIRKGTPQEVLAKELVADAWNILDKHGWVVPEEVLKATTGKLRGLAKSLGLEPEVAVKTFNDYLREARLAFLDISYRATGMPTYERIFKGAAKEMGLDPDLAWQRYLGERARFMPKLDERGRLVDLEEVQGALFQAPEPKVGLEAITKAVQAGYRVLSEGPDAPGAMRILYSMPATAQESILKNAPGLAERNAKYVQEMADVASRLDEALETFFGRLRGGDFMRYLPERGSEDANKVLGRLRAAARSDNPARLAFSLSEARQSLSGEQVMRMLASKSPTERGLGYAVLGTTLEDFGDYAMASIAHSLAATNLLKAEKKATARYFYMSGGHVLDNELVNRLKSQYGLEVPAGALPRVTEEIQDLLRSATTLDGDTVQAVYSWMASVPAGNRMLLLDELAKVETPAGLLAQLLARGDRAGLKDLFVKALSGGVPTDGAGLESILGLARKVLGEEEVADALYKVGLIPTTDLAQARTLFLDNLMAVEKRAIERFWAEHPRWMGATDRKALLGEFKDGKWVGYPYSPLQWMADVRQGYARKVYLGNISPEAAKAAITANRLALISEVEADTLPQRAVEYLREIGRAGDVAKAEKAFRELVEYIKASDGRYVYTAEAFAKILKQHWPEMDSATFNALLHDVINGPGKEYTAYLVLSKVQSGLNIDVVGAPIAQAVPGAMRERLAEELTRHLVQLYDVEASLAEFARYASRQGIAGHIQDQLYKVLKEAGLVYGDRPPLEVVKSTHLRFVQVPDTTVYMGEAGERAYVWGPLAGKWVPKAIYEDLNRTLSVDPISGTAFASFLTFWRKALLNSPDTVVRNFLGNIWLTWLTTGPEQALTSLRYLPKAFRALREYAETGRIAELGDGAIYMLKEASLTGELREVVEGAAARIAQAARGAISGKGVVQRTIEALDKVLNDTGRTIAKYFTANPDASPLTRALSSVEMFAYLENAQRLANYFAAKELAKAAGRANPEAYAMWVAMNATHDYRSVPYALTIVRNYGIVAFPSFMYLTAVAVGRALTRNPSALTMPTKLASLSFYTNTDSPEDHARIAAYMPEWLAQAMPFVLPVKREDGSYLVMPLSYAAPVIPIEPTSLATEVVGLGFLRPFIEAAYGLTRDEPVPVFSGQFGKRLFPDAATPGEKALGVGAYVVKSFTPRWITRYSPVSDPELLLRDLTVDQSALQSLDSVVGKLWVQYKHPAIVEMMERRLGRQLGMTAPEAVASLLATPRRVSPDPLGVGSRARALEPERMKNEILRDFSEAVKRGVNIERARERALRELEKVEKKLLPLLELNEIFGPPPNLGGEYGPP